MRIGVARSLVVVAVSLWLAGCVTDDKLSNSLDLKTPGADAFASAPPRDGDTTGSIPAAGVPTDDLALGKGEYRAGNFALAEKHFRDATDLHPRDSEAWIGLAASYDRRHRFDLADRAYAKAVEISGATAAILNNEGYSYMLRGDTKRAREKLTMARRKDPSNIYAQNNLRLLDESVLKDKRVQ
jgi:Flp pilus assembly protein TadD